jgi:lysozyme
VLDQQLGELMDDEGLRLFVYDDATGRPIKPGTYVKGHPTIGIGRALDVHGISQPEAAQLLAHDIFVVESVLGKLPWFLALDPVRRGVMTNLGFNMGVQGLLAFSRMIGALHRLDFFGAADELAASRWAGQVQRSRRDRLLEQLRFGMLGGINLPPVVSPAVPVVAETNSGKTPANTDNVADALNQAELDRIRGTGQ